MFRSAGKVYSARIGAERKMLLRGTLRKTRLLKRNDSYCQPRKTADR